MQAHIRTIHVYLEEVEEEETVREADPEPEDAEPTRYTIPGVVCLLFLCLLCIGVPLGAVLLPSSYVSPYDTTVAQNLTLTLALHPTGNQLQLTALNPIRKTEQVTVSATGTFYQSATQAEGLLTFYNGLFAPQTVSAGTTLTGKDGIPVTTSHAAIIPAATPTTPPTYGTVSVPASSTISGTPGNIAANAIDTACCGSSILVQNLYAFNAKEVPVLTTTDLSTGTHALISQVNAIATDRMQAEINPGYIVLPLTCSQTLTANHHPGEYIATAILTLKERCTPLAYAAADVVRRSQTVFPVPHGSHLVSLTVLVLTSQTTPTGGRLRVHAIAYLKQDRPTGHMYHFAGNNTQGEREETRCN